MRTYILPISSFALIHDVGVKSSHFVMMLRIASLPLEACIISLSYNMLQVSKVILNATAIRCHSYVIAISFIIV